MKAAIREGHKIRIMIACIALAVVSVIYGIHSLSAGKNSSGANAGVATHSVPGGRLLDLRFDPTLNNDTLTAGQKIAYDAGRRNIFRMLEPPAPPDQHRPVPLPAPNPTPPVTQLPSINLQFFGFHNRHGEAKRIFLAQDDEIFVAREGEIVNRRYKIIRITGVSVTVEDMLNGNQQTIPLIDRPPAG